MSYYLASQSTAIIPFRQNCTAMPAQTERESARERESERERGRERERERARASEVYCEF